MLIIVLTAAYTSIRLLLPLVTSFYAILVVIVMAEVLGSPVTIMADAAVTLSCTEEGEYGRYRLWGAIGENEEIVAEMHSVVQ